MPSKSLGNLLNLTGNLSFRPHLLPPEVVIQAHLARPLAAQQSQLNAKLQNTQAENEKLFAEVEAQRNELEALISELERICADVDGANGLLTPIVADLAREGREVEVEMAGT
jgi:kinetochore protein NNF1